MLKRFFKYITQRHRIALTSVLCLIVVYASAQTILFPRVDIASATHIPQAPQEPKKTNQTKPANTKIIKVVKSKVISKRLGDSIQVLKDSVILFHEGAYLYCDSAYFSQEENTFEAFSNVRMEQGDTLFLYGKYMHYDGSTRLVQVREDVSLVHEPQGVTLFTDNLDFDRTRNLGYYFNGGMLVDSLNELTSLWGQYEPNINLATFEDSVVLTNPKFVLYSNYLLYHTDTKIANITTPTTIVSDSGFIYTSNGWYNTSTEESLLLDQSTVVNKQGNRILRGDSISYKKALGYGEVFGNMFLQDTAKQVILRGHYGFYNELTDYAMATDSAFAIEYSQGDSLYIHADTLKLIAIIDTLKLPIKKDEPVINIPDSLMMLGIDSLAAIITDSARVIPQHPIAIDSLLTVADSLRAIPYLPAIPRSVIDSVAPQQVLDSVALSLDSVILPIDSLKANLPPEPVIPLTKDSVVVHRMIKAYYGVRFYRSDIQGVCDSLQSSSKDSILHMYKDPVLWNTGANITNRQLFGDTIDVFMNDSTIDYMHVRPNSFAIEEKDSIHYNQLKSRSLKIYFENQKTKRVFAEGNVQSIAYPEEKDGGLSLILNWLEASFLNIDFVDGLFTKMVAYPSPVTKTIPFELVTTEDLKLKDFYWLDYLRPVDKDDIFRKVTRKADAMPKRRSSVFDRVE